MAAHLEAPRRDISLVFLAYQSKILKRPLRVFDGNCDTGIKGIRFLKAFNSNIKKMVFCDRFDSVELIVNANLVLNRLEVPGVNYSRESRLFLTSNR